MRMLKNWKIKENLIKVLKMYPIVLSCFFVIGILAIFSIHSNVDDNLISKINLSIAVFAGFALVLRALNICYEKLNNKVYFIFLLGAMILSASYYFTLDIDKEWTIIRTAIILFIQGLLFISLPFTKDDDRAEHFTNQAAGRLIISGLLYGIAYGGVAGILFALEELFGLDISEKVYQDSAIILATTFLPMLWLAGLDFKAEHWTAKLYKILLSYVCIPLLFIYSAVVYGFIIKIAVEGFTMPGSLIGNLVLWYSFASIVVIYLARPYQDNPQTKFFYKWYPLISVLPIAIMFIAIFMRINQYAFTINRYYLLLGGIWLALIFGYLIFVKFAKKKRLNIVITLSIALFALISIAEPISANTIAEKSQLARLEKTVTPYVENNTLDISQMSKEDKLQTQDILQYLRWQHFGYELEYGDYTSFNENIPFMTRKQAKEILAMDLREYMYQRDGRQYFYAGSRGGGGVMAPIAVEGYKYLIHVDSYDYNDGDVFVYEEYEIQVENKENRDDEIINSIIHIYKNQEPIAELSLLECFGDELKGKGGLFGEIPSDFVYETPDKSIKLVLYAIEFWYDEEVAVTRFEGALILK